MYRPCFSEHGAPFAQIFGATPLDLLPNVASLLHVSQATTALNGGGFTSLLWLSTLPGDSTKRRGEGTDGVPEAAGGVA